MSYINIVGNGVTNTSYTSYRDYTLDNTVANTLFLEWSLLFIDTPYVVAGWTDITPLHAGINDVAMPTAIDTSTGIKVTFGNPGANPYNVLDNLGNLLVAIGPGQIWDLVLYDNTTQGGQWRLAPHGGGYAAITSINAVAQNNVGQVPGNIVITGTPGLPITAAGTINVNLGNDLQALTNFGANTGLAYRTAVNTWQAQKLVGISPITILPDPLNPTNTNISINEIGAVTSVNATVPDATDAANLTIVGGPITSSGTFNFGFDGDLLALISFGAATGIPMRVAAGIWNLLTITKVRFNGITGGALPQNCTILSQSNIASVSHTAVGTWTVTFTAPLPTNTYIINGACGNSQNVNISYSGALVNQVVITAFVANTGVLIDVADISISIAT